jgi:outer membrane protein OmpA-like peptidoglycan-associated protein
MTRTMATATIALLAITLSPLQSAHALPEDAGFRIGLYGGVLIADPDETITTGPTMGLRLGWQFNRVFALEGNFGYSQNLVDTQAQRLARVLTPRLDLLIHIPTDTVFTPFFVVGPGLIYKRVNRDASVQEGSTNPDGYGLFKNPDTDFLWNIGGGALVQFGELPLFFRLDLRYLGNAGTEPHGGRDGDYFNYMEITGSLTGRFGDGGPKDSDGDGLLDREDLCPQQPEDFDDFVDGDGCPDPDNDEDGIEDDLDECPDTPEDEDGWEDRDGCPDTDNDGDGFMDREDECPDEAEDVDDFEDVDGCPDPDNDEDGTLDVDDECPLVPGPEASFGCPDGDEDRVPDYRDDCPDEKCDERADPKRSDGCPSQVVVTEEEVVILDKVYFEYNKDIIRTVSYDILDQVAEVLDRYQDIERVEVQGHTDSDGTEEANLDLSQRRAESVVEYLVEHGIDRDRLTSIGYGEAEPIDTNDTKAGRANNRRVQFKILDQ